MCNKNKKIIADIKNKYNTTKGSDQVKIYDDLDNLVSPKTSKYHDYTAYYVEIIPKQKAKKPSTYDEYFTPSDKSTGKNRPPNPQVKKIDGKSFYTLVTGVETALEDLFIILPTVISSITHYKLNNIELIVEQFNKSFPACNKHAIDK